jgi:phenylalanine-4-hydroxylase
VTHTIPEHLLVWTVEQKPELYTPIDHAAWRYIMRVSGSFFKEHAHELYNEGLQRMGISRERIPSIHEMDNRMRDIGWRAVAVSGFIPPQIFMEFQSLGILPIACDMRQFEHILYTPAPDVVHEAAGHAPIIADPDYSRYLKAYGSVSRRAIYSHQDMAVYRAIRRLSELKEDPHATAEEIAEAQEKLDAVTAETGWISESAELSRMYWWTVEYGLVGEIDNPRIYGAGLLSSAGESYRCLGAEVRHLPMSLDCITTSYDITKPQPQLFVTPDFKFLLKLLEEYAATMACNTGGMPGLEKALKAHAPVTVELDSGLEISGVLTRVDQNEAGEAGYLQFTGPAMLGTAGAVHAGHSRESHAEGFGTPLGPLKRLGVDASGLDLPTLRACGFVDGEAGRLEFESGVVLVGRLQELRRIDGRSQLIRFDQCRVTRGEQVLFDPAWGHFDLACGSKVISVSGGWLDRSMDKEDLPGERPRMNCTLTAENRERCGWYLELRRLRDRDLWTAEALESLAVIADTTQKWPEDWLIRLELIELGQRLKPEVLARLRAELDALANSNPETAELVERGLALL